MLKKLATLLTASLFVICLTGAIKNLPDRDQDCLKWEVGRLNA